MNLQKSYDKYKIEGDEGGGDKGTCHSYIDIYEKYLQKYVNPISLLEIGVFYGNSLMTWKDYFHPDSYIIGVDIIDRIKFPKETFDFIEGDILNPFLYYRISDKKFDVIIDDGSHILEEQVKTFERIFPLLKKGGFYFIEDVVNIDTIKDTFLRLHPSCEVHDLRHIKNRYDDVLIVYKK